MDNEKLRKLADAFDNDDFVGSTNLIIDELNVFLRKITTALGTINRNDLPFVLVALKCAADAIIKDCPQSEDLKNAADGICEIASNAELIMIKIPTKGAGEND